jgi:hypothetical protein
MNDHGDSSGQLAIWPLIRVPAIITLAVTILRLVGELEHWSKPFFDPQAGGGNAIVGITWLAPLFGIYFAVRLVRDGHRPASTGRALAFAVLGSVLLVGSTFFGSSLFQRNFHLFLLYIWGAFALAAIVTLPAWRELFRVQLAYAYAARIPVAIIMFFAIRGNWGTHYDIAPPNVGFLNYFTKYLWIGFFAQLVFWVGYTIVSGMLFGTITAAVMRGAGRAPQPSSAARAA